MPKQTTSPDAARHDEPIVKIVILTNGILIGDAHHSAGKIMDLPKGKADVLAGFTPPAVKIIGV